jgi:antitoxin HigA-1
MLPKNRPPIHPGQMLLKDFLEPMGITQKEFSKHLGWTYARLNEIIRGRRGVTAESALAFAGHSKWFLSFG